MSVELFLAAMRYSYENAGLAEFNAPTPPDRPHTRRLARAIDACLPFNRDLRRDFILWHELWLRGVRDTESRSLAGDLYLELRDWMGSAIRDGIAAGDR